MILSTIVLIAWTLFRVSARAQNPPASQPVTAASQPAAPALRPLAAVKVPVPSSTAQEQVEKTIKAVYRKEFASKRPEEQVALATRLIGASALAGTTPTERFILLREAANVAATAGDAEQAMQAVDGIAKEFLIRTLDFKSSLLQNAARGALAKDPAHAYFLVSAALDVAELKIRAADYEGALKLSGTAEQTVRNAKDDSLAAEAAARIAEIRRVRNEFVRLAPALEKLQQDPADPASNLRVGRFYCLAVGDWGRGIPYLQRGSDDAVKALANADVASPQDMEGRLKVADGWWEFAAHEPGNSGSRAKLRAQEWYRLVEKEAQGVTLVMVQQRLAESDPAAGFRTVNLLRLVKPDRDAIAGIWEIAKNGGGLQSGPQLSSRIQFPYEPPAEYDFVVDFTYVSGSGYVTSILPMPSGSAGAVAYGMIGQLFGSHGPGVEGPMLKRPKKPVRVGERVKLTLKVRKESVVGLVNGDVLFDVKPDVLQPNVGPWNLTNTKAVGVGCDQTVTLFNRVEVKEISGPGIKK